MEQRCNLVGIRIIIIAHKGQQIRSQPVQIS